MIALTPTHHSSSFQSPQKLAIINRSVSITVTDCTNAQSKEQRTWMNTNSDHFSFENWKVVLVELSVLLMNFQLTISVQFSQFNEAQVGGNLL